MVVEAMGNSRLTGMNAPTETPTRAAARLLLPLSFASAAAFSPFHDSPLFPTTPKVSPKPYRNAAVLSIPGFIQ
jgi:hypothetical protein